MITCEWCLAKAAIIIQGYTLCGDCAKSVYNITLIRTHCADCKGEFLHSTMELYPVNSDGSSAPLCPVCAWEWDRPRREYEASHATCPGCHKDFEKSKMHEYKGKLICERCQDEMMEEDFWEDQRNRPPC